MPDNSQAEVERFIQYIESEKRLSKYTVRNYSHAISNFRKWLAKQKKGPILLEVQKPIIRDYLIDFQERLSRRTLHNHFSALRSFYKYLVAHKKITVTPFIGVYLPKLNKLLPKFLTEKQMKELLRAPIKLLETERLPAWIVWRDRLVLELLYGAGLRVSEASGLNYANIEWDNATARIHGKGGKERLSPLGEVALFCLRTFYQSFAQHKSQEDPVLVNENHKRLSVRQIQHLLKKYLALAELPMDISPHKIRHSYATHMLNHGADLRVLKELLGHSSLSTTQLYTHVDISRLKKAHQLAHPRS